MEKAEGRKVTAEQNEGKSESGQSEQIEKNAESKEEKVEVVMPVPFDDQKLIKRTDSEGSKFENVHGREIKTYSEELGETIFCLFERFETLGNVLFGDREIDSNLHEIFRSVLYREKLRFSEIFVFINQNVGQIGFTAVAYDDACYRPERVVDAWLIPPDPDERNAGPMHDVDPETMELLKQIPADKTAPVIDILKTLKRGDDFYWYPIAASQELSPKTLKNKYYFTLQKLFDLQEKYHALKFGDGKSAGEIAAE